MMPVQRDFCKFKFHARPMKAIVYTKYGTPDVLELKEVEKPVPKDDEVLVKVHAVSLNDWDVALLDGDFINRMMNGVKAPKIQILGSDIAGRIEQIGKNVSVFKVGDEVYGDLSGRWGGFAEYVCAPENALALKSPKMSFEQAAAFPQAGMLAVQGLIDKGKIKAGQKVLVNGAGGGVGTFAVQLGKLFGVEMTGVDTDAKFEMLRSLGYNHLIDYTKTDFTRTGLKYDLILDVKTNRSAFDYFRALNPGGIYATVGGSIGKLLQIFLLSGLISMTSKKKIVVVALKANKDLDYINKLFEAGKIKAVIDGPYPLDQVPEAFRKFAKGLHKGKVVFTV
jgi:NADPH:quinone reductase-like Zn-dependent oxidoreductase